MTRLRLKHLIKMYVLLWIDTYLCSAQGTEIIEQTISTKYYAETIINYFLSVKWNSVHLFVTKDPKQLFRQFSASFITASILQLPTNAHNLSLPKEANNNEIQSKFHGKIVVWCGVDCQQQVIAWATRHELLSKRNVWLFVEESESNKERLLRWPQLPSSVLLESNAYVISPSAALQNHSLEFCRLRRDGPNRVRAHVEALYRQNQWEHISGQFIQPLKHFHLKIGTMHMPPRSVIEKKGNETTYGGYAAVMTTLLSKYLGFSYEYVVSPKRSYGALINGSCDGLTGMLHKKEVDLVTFPLAITHQRLSAAQFSPYLATGFYVGVIRKPTAITGTFDFHVYTDPFPLVVWTAMMAMIGLTFICLLLVIKSQSVNYIGPPWRDDLWNLISMSLQMDIVETPRKRSSHLMILSFLMFIVLISRNYGTFFTASLTIKKTFKMFETIDELLDAGTHRTSILRSAVATAQLKKAPLGTLLRLWKNIVKHDDFPLSYEEGLREVLEDEYVLIAPFSMAEYFLSSNCDLTYIKEKILTYTLHIGLPINSPFQEAIANMALTIRSSGVLPTVDKKSGSHVYNPDDCYYSNELMTAGLHETTTVFLLLVFGYTFSFLMFSLELCRKRKANDPQS